MEKKIKETTLEKSLTSDLEENINIAQSEIKSFDTEKIKEVKRIEKLGIKKEKIREVIKDSLHEVGIEVI